MYIKKMKISLIICLTLVLSLAFVKNEDTSAEEPNSTASAVGSNGTAGIEDVMKLLEEENFEKNFETVEPDMSAEKKELEQAVNQAVVQMGLDKNENMDRETFKRLFTKVVLQEDELPESEMALFNKLIERVINNAPESFKTADVNKYIDLQFITAQLNDIMTEEGYDPSHVMGEGDQEEEEDVHPDDSPKVDL